MNKNNDDNIKNAFDLKKNGALGVLVLCLSGLLGTQIQIQKDLVVVQADLKHLQKITEKTHGFIKVGLKDAEDHTHALMVNKEATINSKIDFMMLAHKEFASDIRNRVIRLEDK